jgi:hypothetical protein
MELGQQGSGAPRNRNRVVSSKQAILPVPEMRPDQLHPEAMLFGICPKYLWDGVAPISSAAARMAATSVSERAGFARQSAATRSLDSARLTTWRPPGASTTRMSLATPPGSCAPGANGSFSTGASDWARLGACARSLQPNGAKADDADRQRRVGPQRPGFSGMPGVSQDVSEITGVSNAYISHNISYAHSGVVTALPLRL